MTKRTALLFAVATILLPAQAIADSIKSTAIRCRSEESCKVAWLKAVQLMVEIAADLADDPGELSLCLGEQLELAERRIVHDALHGPGGIA